MYKKGEFVIYGTTGVCEILDITTMDREGTPKGKLYYVLHPYYQNDGKIFTPVENQKTYMRRIVSKEEASALIGNLSNIGSLRIANSRMREAKYKECIKSCECEELVKVIKTLYLLKKERGLQGKKITATDDRYLKIAEETLVSELSIPLGVSRNEIAVEIEKQFMN